MRVSVILNRDGGTLKTMDLAAFCDHVEAEFTAAGHDVACHPVPGKRVMDAIEKAAGESDVDAIVAGGGDGTISGAAAIAWRAGKALGIIPAGTMNLYARTIGVPLAINEAVTALANGTVTPCDISTADGRPFVHQFAVGMQSRLIKNRSKFEYRSRFGKILASFRAGLETFVRLPTFPATLTIDGEKGATDTYSLISVSNNPFGEGHLPFADTHDAGQLGVYTVGILEGGANAQLAADFLIGAWTANENVHSGRARSVILEFPAIRRKVHAVVDGELIPLRPRVEIGIHPGALKVIMPQTG